MDNADFDPLLIDAALDGRLWLTDLTYPERLWIVQSLAARGESVPLICERLHTSRSTVQRLRREIRLQVRLSGR